MSASVQMNELMLLDKIERVAEQPFADDTADQFAWLSLDGCSVELSDVQDIDHVRVAMLGTFTVGRGLLPRIVVSEERAEYGVPLCVAEAGFLDAADELENAESLPIPDDYVLDAMEVDFVEPEIELVSGLQIYSNPAQGVIIKKLIVNRKMRDVSLWVWDLLSRYADNTQVLQSNMLRRIYGLDKSAQERLAYIAATNLLVKPLEDFRRDTDMWIS